ncbi:MAG: hypothetical protein R2939_20215 [Kofleriaceae bacterium]
MLALVAGCAGAPPPVVTPAHEAWARQQWSDHSPGELAAGRDRFQVQCARCHRPPAPSLLSAEEWPAEVAEMGVLGEIAAQELRVIERYLVAVTSAAPTP